MDLRKWRTFRLLAWGTFIGMFLVLLAGALVTKTGSGRGCGSDWPLCNGKFIPAYTLESMIEYSHRMVTGVVGLLVIITFIYTWRYLRHPEALLYAGGTLLFTIIQALMGAAAVIWPQQPAVMALHFGISLLAVACSMLLVLWSYRMKRIERQSFSRQLPAIGYLMAWGIWLFCYGVVYLGAYIRHKQAGGGCKGWPLCNGQLIPDLSGPAGIVFAHRAAALILLLIIIGFYALVRCARWKEQAARAGLRPVTLWALILVIAQIGSGALLGVVAGNPDLFLFASLLHNVLATILFCILSDQATLSYKHHSLK